MNITKSILFASLILSSPLASAGDVMSCFTREYAITAGESVRPGFGLDQLQAEIPRTQVLEVKQRHDDVLLVSFQQRPGSTLWKDAQELVKHARQLEHAGFRVECNGLLSLPVETTPQIIF